MAVDRIEELQRQAAEQKRQSIDNEARIMREREQARILEEAQAAQKKEERRQFVRRVTDDVLRRSGINEELRSIETRLIGNTAKHALIIDLDKASVRLIWGSRFQVNSEGEVERQASFGGLLKDLVLDYSFIGVSVDPDAQAISINNKSPIPADEWTSDRSKIIDGIAKAYLDPQRVVIDYSPRRDSGSSSSSSSSSECCCQ